MNISDMQAGKAGEYLVCADLILQGYIAFPSEQGLPYDVVAQGPNGLVKIQVKSMRMPRPNGSQPPLYIVSATQRGKKRRKKYSESDADVFAFVALDEKSIAYIARAVCKTCLQFRSEANRGKYQSEQIEVTAKRAIEMRATGMRLEEIGEALGVSRPQAARYLKIAGRPKKGKYFSDFPFADAIG